MRYWLTTHYPHRTASHPYNLYVKEAYRQRVRDVSMGDEVAFYEILGRGRKGRQAIVAIAQVAGGIRPNRNHEGGPDERDEVWEWAFPCAGHDFDGLVARERLTELLDYGRNFNFRYAGGTVEISAEQFAALRMAFTARR